MIALGEHYCELDFMEIGPGIFGTGALDFMEDLAETDSIGAFSRCTKSIDLWTGAGGAVLVHGFLFAMMVLFPVSATPVREYGQFMTVNLVMLEGRGMEPVGGGPGNGSEGEVEAPACALPAPEVPVPMAQAVPEYPVEEPAGRVPVEPEPVPIRPEPISTEPERPKQVEKPKPRFSKEPTVQREVKSTKPARLAKTQAETPVGLPSPAVPSPNPVHNNGDGAGNGAGAGRGADTAGSGSGSSGSGAGSEGTGMTEFQVTQVDKVPEVIFRVEPSYPFSARRQNICGKVTVKFLVDPSGAVKRPSIVDASPRGLFDQCALEAVSKWRFKPGYYKGRAVSTWMVLPIQFKLTS